MKLQIPPATNTVVVRYVNDEPLKNHDRDNVYVLHIDIEETSISMVVQHESRLLHSQIIALQEKDVQLT